MLSPPQPRQLLPCNKSNFFWGKVCFKLSRQFLYTTRLLNFEKKLYVHSMYVVCIWRKIVIFSKQTVFVQVRGGVWSSQPQHWIYKPFVRNKLFLVSQIASFRKRPRKEHELKTTEHWASSQNKVRVKRKGREVIAYLLSCSDTISIAVVVTRVRIDWAK